MEETAQFLAFFIVSLIAAGISYRQSTRKGAARSRVHEEKSTRLELDNRELSARVADLEVIVKDQRTQIAMLSHFQTLYETLKEAHDGLKCDHDELKAKFEARDTALQTLQSDLAGKDTCISDLEKQNSDLFEANKQLASRIRAYEDFARILGVQLKREPAGTPPAGESPAPEENTIEQAAEPAETQEKQTNGTA